MLEVEVKFRGADRAATVAALLEMGAQLVEDRTDADLYFRATDRDLKATDEAFRLRRMGAKSVLTYKGPRRDTDTKTRAEIEVPLAPGAEAAERAEQLFAALGYTPVTTVRKKRRIYQLTRDGFHCEACFDAVEGVGEFVELEIVAEEADYERAKATVLALAAELGLSEKEPRSYLRMVLQAQGAES